MGAGSRELQLAHMQIVMAGIYRGFLIIVLVRQRYSGFIFLCEQLEKRCCEITLAWFFRIFLGYKH